MPWVPVCVCGKEKETVGFLGCLETANCSQMAPTWGLSRHRGAWNQILEGEEGVVWQRPGRDAQPEVCKECQAEMAQVFNETEVWWGRSQLECLSESLPTAPVQLRTLTHLILHGPPSIKSICPSSLALQSSADLALAQPLKLTFLYLFFPFCSFPSLLH